MIAADRKAVLMFHGIGEPPVPIDDDEREYWIGWDAFDAIVEAVAARPDCERIVFTFDDGNASDLEAGRRLAAKGLRGIFFVLTGRIGQPGYLSADDMRELLALGMEIGSHGHAHVDWASLGQDALRAEVEGARDALATIVGRPVNSVAIPFGSYNRRVHRHLQRSAYPRVYTSDPGIPRTRDRFVRRLSVRDRDSAADVIRMIDARLPLGRRLRQAVAPLYKRLR